MWQKSLLYVACIFSACAKPPAHVKQTDNVMKPFVKTQEVQYALHGLGQGGYFTGNQIDMFYADFDTTLSLSEEGAKELLYNITMNLKHVINTNEAISPYIKDYPVTIDQISLSIGFVDAHKKPREQLSQVHLYKGEVYYSSYNTEENTYISYKQEPLAE